MKQICLTIILVWISVCSAYTNNFNAHMEHLKKRIVYNSQYIRHLKLKENKQKKELLEFNKKLQQHYPPMFDFKNDQKKPSLWLLQKKKKEAEDQFYPDVIYETADHRNSLSVNPFMSMNEDIFADMKGLKINNGVSSRLINGQNTVYRSWIDEGGLSIEGKFLDDFHFSFIPNFGRNQFYISQALLSIDYYKLFGLRGGYQTSLVSGMDAQLEPKVIYPGFTTNMAPTQEYGLVLYGTLGGSKNENFDIGNAFGFRDHFSYQIGVYNGTADGVFPYLNPAQQLNNIVYLSPSDFNANKQVEGRIFYNPFFDKSGSILENLGIGFAASTQRPSTKSILPFILTVGQNIMFGYFDDTTTAVSSRSRIHPQLIWYKNQWGLYFDWTQTSQQLVSGNEIQNRLQSFVVAQKNQASDLQVFYNLTGEDFSIEGIEPSRNFIPGQTSGYGAWQLFGRFTTFSPDPDTFSHFKIIDNAYVYYITTPRRSVEKATAWSIGLNWFWNKSLKIRAEFAETFFKGGCSTGAYLDPSAPGCLTANDKYVNALDSQVINRPNEYIFMQSLTYSF